MFFSPGHFDNPVCLGPGVLPHLSTSRVYLGLDLLLLLSVWPHSAGDTQGSLTQKPQGKLVESLIPPTSLPICSMGLEPESHLESVGQPWEAC